MFSNIYNKWIGVTFIQDNNIIQNFHFFHLPGLNKKTVLFVKLRG